MKKQDVEKNVVAKSIKPENTLRSTMELNKTDSLIPSDYIMSSLDIAMALGWKHDQFIEEIKEYDSDCDCDFSNHNFYESVIVRIEGKPVLIYLFDFNAVRYIAEQIIFHPDHPEDPQYRNKILKRFFELASDPLVMTAIYDKALRQLVKDNRKRKEFENRLRICRLHASQSR